MVSSHFPSDVLPGRDATWEKVVELLPAATVVHFSCHGTLDERLGYMGVLLLADTAELTYQHLWKLPLSARLVVLSACGSGLPAITVEHALNLPNGFLGAGAAAVLGTLWRTDELASLLLLTRFYQLWAEKKCSLAEALGEAQNWLAVSPARFLLDILDPQALQLSATNDLQRAAPDAKIYAHPWYWAGFFLAGD
jgi:CHAT domain-containing protein